MMESHIYTANTNYRLMNDIDLSDAPWKPISVPVSGIFDGNGHSIKNMTIASSNNFSYKEVGLFKVYSGIVSNLNMENVTIDVPGYITTPTSITGKGGVGAFAGFMGSGTFKNCTVSGSISSNVDNVGGLVGHTDENVIIKLQNCTNYANITAYDNSSSYGSYRYNVGGLIGCAMCSLSVNNCNNEGSFNGNASNVGGLIGHVESEGYEEKNVKAGYAEDGNTITLLIGNSRSEGEYDLYLEDYDLHSLNILPGGIFTVYDSTLEPIEGFENITLEEGRLRIGTVNIKFEGRDTYFVKDITPVEGYRKIAGYIKVVVTRYWDFDAEKFRVTVDSKVIDENKIQDELGNNTDIDLDSISDTFAPEITFENVGWNTAKAVFIGCTNNGVINGYCDIAGIVGSAHKVKTTFENCTNNKAVSGNGYGKAAGMVAELYCWGDGVFCEINNCKNYGKISSAGSTGSTGGMAAQVISNIRIAGCENEGEIYSDGPSGSAGIVCDVTGMIYIDKCKNSGTISTNYNNVNAEAGGIVAKNTTYNTYAPPIGLSNYSVSRDENNLIITDCENTGDIYSASHFGGIVGCSEAGRLVVDNCKAYSKTPDRKLELHDRNAADKGGIVGYACVPDVAISNCTTDNVDLKRTSTKSGDTYGATGGIIGNWCSQGNMGGCNLDKLTIVDCEVKSSDISTKGHNTAGIIGEALDTRTASVEIARCKVDECDIHNLPGNSTYASVAGIIAVSHQIENLTIDSCDVNNSKITLWEKEVPVYGDCNAAGICGIAYSHKSINIINSNVNSTKIKNYTAFRSGCSTTAGIIAHATGRGIAWPSRVNESHLVISKCNVTGEDKENKTGDDADIFTNDEDCGGITGPLSDFGDAQISDTSVKNCYLLSNSVDSTSSIMSGGVTYTGNNITMSNCTVDNIVLDLDTPSNNGGTNITGFLGCANNSAEMIVNNCDISNSTFTSPGSYSSLGNISGIAGWASGAATFNECDVYNCKFNGTSIADGAPAAANVSGILGCSTYYDNPISVNECTVKKCEFKSKSTPISNLTNCTLGGLVGSVNKVEINGSEVEDCNFTGGVMCTGGLVGCAYGTANLSKVSVKDITINDDCARNIYNSYGRVDTACRSIGGAIGQAASLDGSKITVSGVTVNSKAISIGGLAGNINTLNTLNSSSVSDFNVVNTACETLINDYGSIGGLVGQVNFNGKTISGCSVSNAKITADYDSVAGLIGVANGTGTISGCSVTGFTGKNKNTFSDAYVGHSGGLIGISTGATLEINSSSVNSSNISIGSNDSGSGKSLGGLIGLSGDVTFNECESNSVTLTNGSAGGCTGGLVGLIGQLPTDTTKNTVIANDSSVTGDVTISSTNHAGGIIGCGKVELSNPTISGITVTASGSNASAGGIAGITDQGSSIDGANVSGITVTATQHAAGMVGVMYGNITGGSVSTVTAKSTGSGIYEVGGVAGVLNGTLDGTAIDSANLTSVSGDVGGAIGATQGSVSNVTVTKTIVNSTKIIGGVVGAGLEGSTTLSNLTVDDETVANITANETATFKGKYIGAPNMYGDDNDLTPQEESTEEPISVDNLDQINSIAPQVNSLSTSNASGTAQNVTGGNVDNQLEKPTDKDVLSEESNNTNNESSNNESSNDETSNDETSNDETSNDETSNDGASNNETSNDENKTDKTESNTETSQELNKEETTENNKEDNTNQTTVGE